MELLVMPEASNIDIAPRRLLRLTLALFLSYLAVAMSLPATSVFVTRQLHFGNAFGGLAVGIAFLSTILTRNYAGNLSDRASSKICMLRGLKLYSLASVICLVSAWAVLPPLGGYAALLAGGLLRGL